MVLIPKKVKLSIEFDDNFERCKVVTCMDISFYRERCPDVWEDIKAMTLQGAMARGESTQRVEERDDEICITYEAPRSVVISSLLSTIAVWTALLMDKDYSKHIDTECELIKKLRAKESKLIYAT